jgi:hypothetical protein
MTIEAALTAMMLLGSADPCSTHVCSCALSADISQGVQEAFHETTAIFVGQALHTSDTVVWRRAARSRHLDSVRLDLVTLKVQRAWKGANADTLQVISGPGTCEYPFTNGESYVVFAYASPGPDASTEPWLSTSIGSYTTELSKADTILTALGPSRRDQGRRRTKGRLPRIER